MNITGTIHSIGLTKQVSDKFSKREFIIKTNETYPQYLNIQVTQDKVSLLDNFSAGQEVECHINLNGRLWTNKEGVETAFNSITAWKITKLNEGVSNPSNSNEGDDQDSLPF